MSDNKTPIEELHDAVNSITHMSMVGGWQALSEAIDELSSLRQKVARMEEALLHAEEWEDHWPACDACFPTVAAYSSDVCDEGHLLLVEANQRRFRALSSEKDAANAD